MTCLLWLNMIRRQLIFLLIAAITLICTACLLVTLGAILVYNKLPSLESLVSAPQAIPLRIYSADNTLIGEFGEERRRIVPLNQVPKLLRQAILAAEDDRFYEHGGVDYTSVIRAALANISARGSREGASTITMQVARNFFLSKEKTFSRKFTEALLAIKIEHNLSKDQILELYINHIYLGERSYGFSAASEVYFGVPMEQLTLSQMAMLAGLPKAPSRDNPIVNPERAKERQRYVLRRMHELKFIDDASFETALKSPLGLRQKLGIYSVKADYVSELVRQQLFDEFGDAAYRAGLSVYTTIKDMNQNAAVTALRQGLIEYDRRHGLREPSLRIDVVHGTKKTDSQLLKYARLHILDNGEIPAVVTSVKDDNLNVHTREFGDITVGLAGAQSAMKEYSNSHRSLKFSEGSLVWIKKPEEGIWTISQIPAVEGALVSLKPGDGAIVAMVGGFDYNRSKFNHVTQGMRQPGSCFKPFVYSAALEHGFNEETIVSDSPTTFTVPGSNGEQKYTPQNYDGRYLGRIPFRIALAKSRNVASVSILNAIGISYAQDYASRFGFSSVQAPPFLTMVLGVGSATPLQMATAYSVFANGGYKVTPYLIDRVVDSGGKTLLKAKPLVAGTSSPRVVDERNAFVMTHMLQGVVQFGTGVAASQLGRHDLAGKTGSTTDYVDAWFSGYNPSLVTVAWVGYDTPKSLGKGEVGGRVALPIWMKYMAVALKDQPETGWPIPSGVVSVSDKSEGAGIFGGHSRDYYLYSNEKQDAGSDSNVTAAP